MRFSIPSKAFHSTHRGWKKLVSRYIVSGTARSEDNENNRHLFVSSVVVVSSTYVYYVQYVGTRTRADYLFTVYTRTHIHKLKCD